MKRLKVFSLLIISMSFLIACTKSPLDSGVIAERHQIKMQKLKKGMNKDTVIRVMGRPNQQRIMTMEGETYEVWYYIIKAYDLGQTEPIDRNLTPLIFKNNKLLGWGYRYYNYVFDINNARQKYQEEKRQQYTDDSDEWPPNEHALIKPPKYDQPEEEQPKEEPKTAEKKEVPIKQQTQPKKEEVEKPKKPKSDLPCSSCPSKEQDQHYHLWD